MSINIMDSYKKKPKTIVMTDGVNKIKIENYKGSVFVSIIKINWAEHIGDDQEFLEHYSEIQVGGFRLDYPLAEPFYNAIKKFDDEFKNLQNEKMALKKIVTSVYGMYGTEAIINENLRLKEQGAKLKEKIKGDKA